MGCTPTKSKGTYTQEKVWGDFETCSTSVSGFNSSVSTPERPSPRPYLEKTERKQTFLSVPAHNYHGHSLSRSITPEGWSTYSSKSIYSPYSKRWHSTKPSTSDSDSSEDETPHRHQQ